MNLQDTPARYGAVSVFNHWLGAAMIVALLAIGLYFEDMPRGDEKLYCCLLYTSPSPRDRTRSRMPSSA